MNSVITQNILRLFFFVLVQGVVLQQAKLGGAFFNYISLFIYPLFLLLLPLNTSRIALVLIGFGLGMLIDGAYNSPGVHTAACLVTAIFRPLILAVIEPREGYNISLGLTVKNYGVSWFLKYAGVLLFIHLLVYFILEIFTPIYALEIIGRTIASFLFSLFLIMMYMVITRPSV